MSENQIIMSENQDKFFCLVIWGTSIMPGRQTCHFRASGLKDFPEEVPGPLPSMKPYGLTTVEQLPTALNSVYRQILFIRYISTDSLI